MAEHSAAGRVQRRPVIAQQPLGITVNGDALRHDRDRARRGLRPSNMGGEIEAGVVVDEMEDDTLPVTGQNIFGPIQLPACLRHGIYEASIRGPRFLPRLHPRNPSVAEDPG